MSDHTSAARHAISGVLSGAPPNGIAPDHCGPWGETVAALFAAYETGGTPAVRRQFEALARANKGLAALVAGDAPPIKEAAPAVPALPADAQEVYAHLAPCGTWLREYITFASHAAPMTPASLHEAAGLFTASVAIARRLCFANGIHTIYPNLYFLFVAPSTIHHKSTGLNVMRSVLSDAGMLHLLMPHKASPQAMVADLDFAKLPTPRQMLDLDAFLQRRAFAAQRGWIRDEASALFASLKQEFNAGLLELILELYECPAHYDELTISRGEAKIQRAYLSFFGVSTPVEMGPHFANLSYWSNGLWARCLVLTPEDDERVFQFFPRTMQPSGAVVRGLRQMYDLFPLPSASLESIDIRDGKSERVIQLHNVPQAAQVILAPGVWEAWETYNRAVSHTILLARAVDEELYACYGRLGTLTMKVAMLLAVMDAERLPVTIELRHYATAQQRVEVWREGLHRLWTSQSATQETRLMEKVLKRLERAGTVGMTTRDLCIALRQPAKEVGEALNLLSKSGKALSGTLKASNGRTVEVWTCQ